MQKTNKILKRCCGIVLCAVLICTMLFPVSSYAAGGIGHVDEFQGLEGDLKYIGDEYRANYYLDMEKTGLLDAGNAMLNSLANVIFSLIKTIAGLVVTLFHTAMDFDMAKLFSDEIDGIQMALKTNVFDPLFLLVVAFSMWEIIKQLAKNNIVGVFSHMGQTVIVLLLSLVIANYSSSVLSVMTQITKETSAAVLMSLSGEETTSAESYATNSSALIWRSLVHDPWVSFEFGDTSPTSEEIEAFLTTARDTSAREKLVEEYMQQHSETAVFRKTEGGERLGGMLVYLILLLGKSTVFLILSFFQLGYQAMGIFYLELAQLILLLSLLPSMGGFRMISAWLKKLLETQIMILVIVFILGLVLVLQQLLYGLTGQFGWMIVQLMEVGVTAFIVINYKTIFRGIQRINRTVQNPHVAMQRLRYSGDLVHTMGSGARTVQHAASGVIKTGASAIKTGGKLVHAMRDSVSSQEKTENGTDENNAVSYRPQNSAPISSATSRQTQSNSNVPGRSRRDNTVRVGAQSHAVIVPSDAPSQGRPAVQEEKIQPKRQSFFTRNDPPLEPIIPPSRAPQRNVVTQRFEATTPAPGAAEYIKKPSPVSVPRGEQRNPVSTSAAYAPKETNSDRKKSAQRPAQATRNKQPSLPEQENPRKTRQTTTEQRTKKADMPVVQPQNPVPVRQTKQPPRPTMPKKRIDPWDEKKGKPSWEA